MKTQWRVNRMDELEASEPGVSLSSVAPAPLESLDQAPTSSSGFWRRAVPTVEGVVWLALAVFFISLRAFNLVTLIGAFMLAMLVLNLFRSVFRGDLKKLRMRRSVQRGVYAGENAQVLLILRNDSNKTQPGLAVSERGSCHLQRWTLAELPKQGTVSLAYSVFMPRRGRYFFGPVEVLSGYPFGLFRSAVRFEKFGEAIVLPEIGTLHRGRLRRLLHSPSQPTSIPERHIHRRSAVPAEFYGVRDFRPGDSPRFIHWRTTARMGIPMVREFEETPLDHLIVVLDAWLPEAASVLYRRWSTLRDQHQQELRALRAAGSRGATLLQKRAQELAREVAPLRKPLDTLEHAISLAATLCWQWQQNAGTQLVLALADQGARVPGRLTSSRGTLPHMEALAVVEGGPKPDHAGVLRQLADQDLPDGPTLLISTRPDNLAEQYRQVLRRPITPLYVGDPGVLDYFTTQAKAVLL